MEIKAVHIRRLGVCYVEEMEVPSGPGAAWLPLPMGTDPATLAMPESWHFPGDCPDPSKAVVAGEEGRGD